MIDPDTTPTVKIVSGSNSYWATTVASVLGTGSGSTSDYTADTITATFTTTATITAGTDIVVHVTGIQNPPSDVTLDDIALDINVSGVNKEDEDYTLETC